MTTLLGFRVSEGHRARYRSLSNHYDTRRLFLKHSYSWGSARYRTVCAGCESICRYTKSIILRRPFGFFTASAIDIRSQMEFDDVEINN